MLFQKLFSKRSEQEVDSMINEWELNTLKGSEHYHCMEDSQSLRYFRRAHNIACKGEKCQQRRTLFMHYRTLSCMNLAHVLRRMQKSSETERVLSEAHFDMLCVMTNEQEPLPVRSEARVQAEALLRQLMEYLQTIGRKNVAESLSEEFSRLCIHGLRPGNS